jgi:structural maintenance of chromosome 1
MADTMLRLTRLSFENERLDELEDRLKVLEKTVISEKLKLEELEEAKTAIQSEITELEETAESAKTVLAEFQETLNEVQAVLEKIKKKTSKASRAYERAIKEIATHNDTIQKLASERFTVYKRCKLEEIDLPLTKGSLDKVPLEEVRQSFLLTIWHFT